MRTAAPSPGEPVLPLGLDRGEIASLRHDDRICELELIGAELSDQHASGVGFETVKLAGVDLSGSRLEHLSIVDGALHDCNLANVYSPRARLNRVVIERSRMTGIDLAQATLVDVAIRGCRVDLASFGSCRLERVTFDDCLLAQTDFLEARLDAVRFHDCELTRGDFRGARLRHCEFRRSDLADLQGIESLRGAAMQWPDIVAMAGAWAAALGVEVLDAD
jgi:uncharacterized protein YjbI with pentapeptide repeats